MNDAPPTNDNSYNTNAFTAASPTNPPKAYNFSGPKSSSIELDSFRSSPAMSGGDEVRFGGTRDDTNGRMAEVGIVLPLVSPHQDPVLNGGEGGGAGDGDKRPKNDAGKNCSCVYL